MSNQEIFAQKGAGLVQAARMVAFGEYEMDGTASAMKARDYKDATDLVFSNDPAATPICFGMDGDVMHDNCMETITTQEGAISDTSHDVAIDLYNQSVSDTNQTLSSAATDASHQGAGIVPKVSMAVRRLTPVECERLQGFPDNFTRIPWRNKPAEQCPDGPRYKALGNSMAVPVMRWIGERIQQFESISLNLDQKEAA